MRNILIAPKTGCVCGLGRRSAEEVHRLALVINTLISVLDYRQKSIYSMLPLRRKRVPVREKAKEGHVVTSLHNRERLSGLL